MEETKPVKAEYDAEMKSEYEGRVTQQLSDTLRFAAAVDGIGKHNKPVRAAQELATADEVLDFFEKCFAPGSDWDKSNGPNIKPKVYSVHDSLRHTSQGQTMKETEYDRPAFAAWLNEATVESAAVHLYRTDYNTHQPKVKTPHGATSAGLPPATPVKAAPVVEEETGPIKPSIH